MNQTWQLQDAKNKLSQLINQALDNGPQLITRHGKEVVIVISYETYQQITASQEKLSDFFRQSPLAQVELDLSRDQTPVRDLFQLV